MPRAASQQELLAKALQSLREEAGLTTYDLAARLGVSQSKISKIENHRVRVKPELVRAWARETGASSQVLDRLAEQAVLAFAEKRSVQSGEPGGFVRQQQRIAALEEAATAIRIFQPAFIPGLLQVHDYVRRVIGFTKTPPDEVAAAVAARIQRQAVLYDTSKQFEILLAEPALRWLVAPPKVMIAQLRYIESAMTLPNIKIGIIPITTEAVDIYLHGFVLFEDEHDGDAAVIVDTWASLVEEEDDEALSTYRTALDALRTVAVYDDDARALLDRTAEEFRRLDQPPARESAAETS